MSVREMNNHMWTKENIKTLLSLWKTSSMKEISEQMGLAQGKVAYMAHTLRLRGIPLTKKRVTGRLQSLIEEVAKEEGLILTK